MAYRENKMLARVLVEMIWPGKVRDFCKRRIAGQGALVFKEMLLSLTGWVLVAVLRFVTFRPDLG